MHGLAAKPQKQVQVPPHCALITHGDSSHPRPGSALIPKLSSKAQGTLVTPSSPLTMARTSLLELSLQLLIPCADMWHADCDS